MKRLYKIIKPFGKEFWVLVLYSLVLNIFTLSNPVVLKFIFDKGIAGKNLKIFLLLVTLFVLLSILWRILNYHYSLRLEKLKIKVTKYWLRKTIFAFLTHPYREILLRDSGYYLSRIYEEPESLSNDVIANAIDFANLLIGLILSFTLLIYFSLYATLILLFIVPVTYLLSIKFSSKIREFSEKERESEANLRDSITEIIKSSKFVKTFHIFEFATQKFVSRLEKFFTIYFTSFKYATGFDTLSSIFLSLSELSVIIVSGYLMIINRMTFGSFMGFMNTFWGFVSAVQRFLGLIPEISASLAVYDRLENFISHREKERVKRSKRVILKNIKFTYDSRNEVFSNFSLEINPGDKVLIMGENGTGKTTLSSILAGLLIPEGRVVLMERVALMPDDLPALKLREFSILDERSKFYEFIKKFGLNEYLDRTTAELSAGQKKKFNITLTLIREAELYIFDEPLANLDSMSKNLAMDLIFENTKHKSLVIISHNASEYEDKFDRVIRLKRR